MTQLLNKYQRDLALRGFAERTCEHYTANVRQFLAHYHLPVEELDSEKIKDYLYHLVSSQASDSKIRQAHGSLKYLFTQTLNRPWEIDSIPQRKKKRKLPSVLTVNEVFLLLDNCANLKHKAMLMTAYSAGLRVSEVVKLQLGDICRDKKRLLIRQAKGHRDRYTVLSDYCLKVLEEYWRQYRPQKWLFMGKDKASPLSTRACQHAFKIAKKNAGIEKEGGVHSLRHSFATHYLEIGGGIFQLQRFLGHRNLKTTLIYAHVQEENIVSRNPLDFFIHEKYS